MADMHSHLKLALASIKCFTDDGTLDEGEVNYLLGLAMADGHVDDEEKRVLASIFAKVNRDTVNRRTWERIVSVRRELSI